MSNASGKSWWKRLVKGLVWAIGVFVVVVFVVHYALWPLALSKEKVVEKRWADAGLPLAGFLDGLPATRTDAAAERLCAAVVPLGFSIKPKTGQDDKGVTKEKADRWDKVKGAVQDYGKAELEKPGPEAAAPTGDAAAFLEEAQPALQEVRGLLQKETPVWISEPGKGIQGAIPNLLGHLHLARVLVADALRLHAAHQDGAALEDLDAAWRLTEPLEGRPELISQLIVIAIRKMDVVALRKLDGVPETWRRRLESWDPSKGMVTSFRAEAAGWEQAARVMSISTGAAGAVSARDRFIDWLLRPYVRLGTADGVGRTLTLVQAFREAGACPSDAALPERALAALESIPWWNVPGKIGFPGFASSWLRVKYARIQIELTDKVLQVKAAKAETGAWPAEVQGIEASFCTKEKWTYVAKEGGVSLTFSAPMPSPDLIKGTRYPQEYREGAGVAAARPPEETPKKN